MASEGEKDNPEADVEAAINNLMAIRQSLVEASGRLWDYATNFVKASTDPEVIKDVPLARVAQDRGRVLGETTRYVSHVSEIVVIIDDGLKAINAIDQEPDSVSPEMKRHRKIARVSVVVEALQKALQMTIPTQ